MKMGTGDEYKCNNNPQQQQQQQRYSFGHQRTAGAAAFVLPMLCRLSIKDVKVIKQCKEGSNDDPSSPKVSCIGQVKRRNSNKIHVGFPFPSSKKHTKLKRFFSAGKNVNPAAAASTGEALRRNIISARKAMKKKSDDVGVDVSELDPPLPVVKKRDNGSDYGEVMSLWNRRRSTSAAGTPGTGTASFNTLHIHLPTPTPNYN